MGHFEIDIEMAFFFFLSLVTFLATESKYQLVKGIQN